MGTDNDLKKIPYPKSILFIVGQEFCERFCYYGMRTVLSLYLVQHLLFDENLATVIFHVFAGLCYLTPVAGAILADSFLGKFRTIFYLSIVYALGSIVLSLASAEQVGIPPTTFSLIGLALIAIGTGGIKPCVSAFGGDQFVLPEQEQQLASFFSIFYFSINAGSLISSSITPIFRKDVNCSTQGTCYPLAFSVPAGLMVVSLLVFLFGRPFYKVKPPEGNIVMKVVRCIGHAISQRTKGIRKSHWLDAADDKFEKSLIEDIKVVLRILFLYVPLPIFWALYDQQGSTWTFQANRMDGYTLGYVIKPDQFQVINAFLILGFIPLFDKIIYPLLAKYNILKSPLQRLTTGGMLAGLAFVASGFLELHLQTTYPVLPQPQEINLNFINSIPCDVTVSLGSEPVLSQNITSNGNYIFELIAAKEYTPEIKIIEESTSGCKSFIDQYNPKGLAKTFDIGAKQGGKAYTLLIGFGKSKEIELVMPKEEEVDDLTKAEGDSKIKVVYHGLSESVTSANITLKPEDAKQDPDVFQINLNGSFSEQKIVKPIKYGVILSYKSETAPHNYKAKLGNIEVASGGNYILSIGVNHIKTNESEEDQPFALGLHTITKPNSVHILWLIPQYIIITVGEIMFSITGLDFSYSQAPESMKSVVQACWLLTVAFGNLIVVGIAKAHFFDKQSKELFLYAGLMFVDMLIFAWMASRYKPRKIHENEMNGNVKSKDKSEDNDGFEDEAL